MRHFPALGSRGFGAWQLHLTLKLASKPSMPLNFWKPLRARQQDHRSWGPPGDEDKPWPGSLAGLGFKGLEAQGGLGTKVLLLRVVDIVLKSLGLFKGKTILTAKY